MNLHLSNHYSFSSEKRDGTSGKGPFQKLFREQVTPAFYRAVLFCFALVMTTLSALSQVSPSVNVPQINTSSGGIMTVPPGGITSGGGGGSSCIPPSFTTNLSTTPYTVTVNGTAPALTVDVSNYTSLQWYKSTNSDGSAAVAISNATGTSYTPDVSTAGTLYYYVVASNYCGSAGSALATVTVTGTQVQPVAGTISGATTVCSGSSDTLTLNGYTGTIQWQSSTDGVTFTDIANATSATYITPGLTDTTYYLASVTSDGKSVTSPSVAIIVIKETASAGKISANALTLCSNSSVDFEANEVVLAGGTGSWSTSDPTVAKIYRSSSPIPSVSDAMVDLLKPGTCTITFTVTGGCYKTMSSSLSITVAEASNAGYITGGNVSVCSGNNSTTLQLRSYFGTIQWQSSPDNRTFTNISTATGDQYTAKNLASSTWYRAVVTSGKCSSATSSAVEVTVNPPASAGTVTAGTTPQCIGSTTTYTVSGAILSGGTGSWSSDNTAVATVDASSGTVTAVGQGTCDIIYTVTGGCGGTTTASQSYSVRPLATAGTVTAGATPQCIGSTTTYTVSGADLEGGTGNWSSSDPSVATVDALSGKVTAVSPGTCQIIYTVTGGCGGTQTASQSYTVNAPPSFTLTPTLTNLYFGVPGNESSTITAALTGGSGAYPYTVTMTMVHTNADGTANSDGLLCNVANSSGNEVWTANGGSTSGNTCGSIPVSTGSISTATGTYSVTVTLLEDADIIVTISDNDGCSTTKTVHISATDARCVSGKSGSDNKVSMCHPTANNKYVQVCIDDSAVDAHLADGDLLGTCPVSYRQIFNTGAPQTFTGKLQVSVLPNPSSGQFSLQLKSGSNDNVNLKVVDLLGRVVEKRSNLVPNSTVQIGSTYSPGVYFVQLLQGNTIINLKLIKKQN